MSKFKLSAILISVFVLLVSSSPILYFYAKPNSKLEFLGRHYTNSQDVYTYVSFIEQAKQGRILFENLYTSEPQKPLLFRPSYLLIGNLAKITGLSSIAAYHAGRIIFSVIFFFALWQFLGHFFKNEKSKFISYCLILTSSGIGFLLFHFYPDAIDLWIPEANTFLSLSEAPHFILSQALMLFGSSFFLDFLKEKKIESVVLSNLFFLLLSFEHPFNLLVILPVVFFSSIWSGISLGTSILTTLGGLPGILYQLYAVKTNSILNAWEAQNILHSPPFSNYLIGFGLLLILAAVAIERLINKKLEIPVKFILTWVTLSGLLIYAPISFQRRLIEAVHVPLAILASGGLIFLSQKIKERSRNWFIAGVILILSGSSIFMTYTDFKMISQDKFDNYYYHIDPAELSAINWLGQNTSAKDTVLSNWYIGNLIPGIIGRKVYLGHKIQTINWDAKNKALDGFINNINPQLSKKFLIENHIAYIFIAKNDILIKNGFNPKNYPNIKSVYEKGGVSIYHVIQ